MEAEKERGGRMLEGTMMDIEDTSCCGGAELLMPLSQQKGPKALEWWT